MYYNIKPKSAPKGVTVVCFHPKYDTLFMEHTLLKLETMASQQKTRKREARWNELKAILDVAPLPMLANEATYHQ
jgi:hypothetical protein